MPRLSRALFSALQQRKPVSELKFLITPDSAKRPDVYYGMRPLLWACAYGHPAEVVEMLLAAYPDAINDKHPYDGWTPVHYVESLDIATLTLLLEKNPGAAGEKDDQGMTPLHWAAEHNVSVEAISLLLKACEGAAREKDKLGRYPYKLATDNGASEVVLDMLEKANPYASTREPVEEALPIGLLFPDLGSQYLNMFASVKDLPEVTQLLEEAKGILGYDVLDLCLNGPEEKLQDPVYSQPVMYVAGVAAAEVLKREKPEAYTRAQAVAGLSLGEYTALTVAGVFSFADGLRLTRTRGEAMKEAQDLQPQGLCIVAGLQDKKVTTIIEKIKKNLGDQTVCQVAQYLFDKGYTLAGTQEAMEMCEKLCKEAKAMQTKAVKGLGACNTSLMEPARVKLQKELNEVLPKMRGPRCKVFMNASAKPITKETEPSKIVELLGDQLTHPVRWRDCMTHMISDGISEFYECGPGKQLKAMMKRIDADAWNATTNIEV